VSVKKRKPRFVSHEPEILEVMYFKIMKIKNTILIVLANIVCATIAAQPKDFEGVVVYKIDTKSKVEGAGDRAWKNMLAMGDSITVMIKQGNYRQSSGMTEMYYISKDEKLYLRFRGLDTLFYMDYSSDTNTVINISKLEETKNIAGQSCKAITISTRATTWKYFYAPVLYMNPEYDKNNRIGQYNVFAKETSSLYLSCFEENESYTVTQTCTRLQPGPLDKNVFELPQLPQKILSAASITTAPKFPRAGGFDKYLQLNLDGTLGAKYIKIPKGEKSAVQTAIVAFMINEKGRVVNAQMVNKDEVHPKLAEEALRVISASPPWTPAAVLGEKIIFWYKQLITFEATK
jgi:Gram-negative bacterial TonB protein C-terminal